MGREWEQDGYRVALPLPLADEAPPAEGPAAEELAELVKDVEAAADAWTARILCVFRCSLQCALIANSSASPAGGGAGWPHEIRRGCRRRTARVLCVLDLRLLSLLNLDS